MEEQPKTNKWPYKKHPAVVFAANFIGISLGMAAAASTAESITYASKGSLFMACFLIGLFNAVLRPILIIFALPFVIFTLGFGILIINALLILLVAELMAGFSITSFWGALWAAVLTGLVSFLLNQMFGTGPVRKERKGVRWSATVRGPDGRVRQYGAEGAPRRGDATSGEGGRLGGESKSRRIGRGGRSDDDVIDI